MRDLARISALDALPRLLSLAAAQTARLLNVADLAAPFQLSRPTIRDYVTLLERVFLLEALPPWHSNRLESARQDAQAASRRQRAGVRAAGRGCSVAGGRSTVARATSGDLRLSGVAATGKRFAAGVVLYDGEITASFGDGFFAVPLRALWETR